MLGKHPCNLVVLLDDRVVDWVQLSEENFDIEIALLHSLLEIGYDRVRALLVNACEPLQILLQLLLELRESLLRPADILRGDLRDVVHALLERANHLVQLYFQIPLDLPRSLSIKLNHFLYLPPAIRRFEGTRFWQTLINSNLHQFQLLRSRIIMWNQVTFMDNKFILLFSVFSAGFVRHYQIPFVEHLPAGINPAGRYAS